MANMLYNGVELPELPSDLDLAQFPYVVIVCDSAGQYSLFANEYPHKYKQTTALGDTLYTDTKGFRASSSLFNGKWSDVSITTKSGTFNYGLDTLVWTNADVIDTDNNVVYMSASDPVDPNAPAEPDTPHITTSSGNGFALYNGVKLPNVPQRDTTVCPYAVMTRFDASEFGLSGYIYTLSYSTMPPYFDGSYVVLPIGGRAKMFMLATTEELLAELAVSGNVNEWNLSDDDYGSDEITIPVNIFKEPALWSNYDILNTDGTVYLAASDPIPLDGMEVIEWDGDTTGLEVVDGLARIGDYIPQPTTGVAVLRHTAELVVWEGVQAIPEYGDGVWSSAEFVVGLVDNNGLGIPSGIYFAASSGIYTQLFAYPASGGSEPTYDRTAFLSGLAMGLCGKGNPTFEGSGKMLYNGVELPNIESVYTPEIKEEYPYAVIVTADNYGAGEARILLAKDTPFTADAGGGIPVITPPVKYSYSKIRGEWVAFTTNIVQSMDYIWSNHDLYRGNEIVHEASDPVPVEDAFSKGYHVGATLRSKRTLPVACLYNDIPLPKQPVWDKEAEPYAVIFKNGDKNYGFWTGNSPISIRDNGEVSGLTAQYRIAERWRWRDKSTPFTNTHAPLWANYDVYASDGTTLLLAASEPLPLFAYPVFDDWLYNGEVFPAPPEWDEVNFPYAFVSGNVFYVTKNLPHYDVNMDWITWSTNDGVHSITRVANAMRTEWRGAYEHDSVLNTSGGLATWANFDVYGNDGTLYLAASEPVPVYG